MSLEMDTYRKLYLTPRVLERVQRIEVLADHLISNDCLQCFPYVEDLILHGNLHGLLSAQNAGYRRGIMSRILNSDLRRLTLHSAFVHFSDFDHPVCNIPEVTCTSCTFGPDTLSRIPDMYPSLRVLKLFGCGGSFLESQRLLHRLSSVEEFHVHDWRYQDPRCGRGKLLGSAVSISIDFDSACNLKTLVLDAAFTMLPLFASL